MENYILKNRKKAARKFWKPEQREKWILRNPKCPMCNQSYNDSNPITKEHIHPIFLGGYERDSNIIPLC